MTTEILLPEDLRPCELDSLSSRAGIFFARPRLAWIWEDRRWTDLLVTVRRGGILIGLLPASVSRLPAWPDELYDVNKAAGEADYEPLSTCLVGGRGDIRGSMLFGLALSGRERFAVADRAVELAADHARASGQRCAGLYISACETELSAALRRAGMRPLPAPARSVIRWPEPTIQSYLAHLSASHRAIVRRDWRKRDSLGVTSVPDEWDSVAPKAAPFIADVLRRHGYQTHPRLVLMRLRRWGALVGDRGFALRARAVGKDSGYAFGWHEPGVVTMYEVGLALDSSPLSRAAYMELLIYGPIAMACARGTSTLDLGIFADEPKRLRGATVEQSFHWTAQAEQEKEVAE